MIAGNTQSAALHMIAINSLLQMKIKLATDFLSPPGSWNFFGNL